MTTLVLNSVFYYSPKNNFYLFYYYTLANFCIINLFVQNILVVEMPIIFEWPIKSGPLEEDSPDTFTGWMRKLKGLFVFTRTDHIYAKDL